jgi:hypothetical protein
VLLTTIFFLCDVCFDDIFFCFFFIVYNVSYTDQNRVTGSFGKIGGSEFSSTEMEVANQAKQMIRNVVSLCNTLSELPLERYLTMKLLFYEDITPKEWQPQHFEDSTGKHRMCFRDKPLKLKVGGLRTKQHCLSMHLSILDDEQPKEGNDDGVEHSWSEDYILSEEDETQTQEEALSQKASPEPEQVEKAPLIDEDMEVTATPEVAATPEAEMNENLNHLNLDDIKSSQIYYDVAIGILEKKIPRSAHGIASEFQSLSKSVIEEIVTQLLKDKVVRRLKSNSNGFCLSSSKNGKSDFLTLWADRNLESRTADDACNSSPETRHTNQSEEEARDKSDESEMGSKDSPVAKKAKTPKNNRNQKAETLDKHTSNIVDNSKEKEKAKTSKTPKIKRGGRTQTPDKDMQKIEDESYEKFDSTSKNSKQKSAAEGTNL